MDFNRTTMDANSLKIYEIPKDSWGEKKAATVMDYLENENTAKIDRELTSKITGSATKEDVYEVKNFVAEKFADNIKWMFIFWVGTIGAVPAVIKFV